MQLLKVSVLLEFVTILSIDFIFNESNMLRPSHQWNFQNHRKIERLSLIQYFMEIIAVVENNERVGQMKQMKCGRTNFH